MVAIFVYSFLSAIKLNCMHLCSPMSLHLGGIHQGCPQLGGGRGLAICGKWIGERGGLAVSEHPFYSDLGNREESI